MKNTIKLLAELLSNKGVVLSNRPNGLFHALEHVNSDDEVYQNIITNLGTAVSNDINMYKNQFIPLIKEYGTLVKNKLDTVEPDSLLTKYSLKEIKIPGYISDLIEKKEVGIEREGRNLTITTLNIPVPEEDSVIKEYITSESPVKQALIKDVTESFTMSEIRDIWNKYLINISSTNTNIDELYSTSLVNLKTLSLLHVILSNMKAKPLSNIKMPESTLQGILSNYLMDINNIMTKAVKQYDNLNSINRLVYSVSEFEVVVHDKVYDKFLGENDSVSINTLLGFVVSGKTDYNSFYMADILTNAEAYNSNWDKLVKQSEVSEVSNKVKLYKTVYSIMLSKFVDELDKDTLEYTDGINQTVAEERLQKLFEETSDDVVLDIDKFSMEVIGDVVIVAGNFDRFMHNVYEYIKTTPSLTMQEAASLAVVDLITDYVLGNLELAQIS